jgi:branched-chain amino acid transport system permease protein
MTAQKPATAGSSLKPPEARQKATPRLPRRGRRARSGLSLLALLAVLVLVPLLFTPYLQETLAARVLIFALIAMSLDLAYGYAGMMSLGQAAFLGVGGYTAGLLMVRGGVTNFWIGCSLALLCTGVVAALFGLVCLRTKGVYFILVTFALGQMVASLGVQWGFLHTNGAEAVVGVDLPEVPPLDIAWSPLSSYYFVLVVAGLATVVLAWLTRSRFGSVLKGIRENEARMSALGYNTWLYKYTAFVLSGVFAGLGGVLFAYHTSIVAPENINVTESGLLLLMVIIGGAGRLYGAAVGGAVIIVVQFFANQYLGEHVILVLGVVFLVAALALKGGIVGRLQRAGERWGRGRHADA